MPGPRAGIAQWPEPEKMKDLRLIRRSLMKAHDPSFLPSGPDRASSCVLDNALVLNVAVVRHLCCVHVQEPDAQALQRESRSDLSFLTEDELLPPIDAARSAELK